MGIKRHTEKSLAIVCTDMEISYRKKTFPDAQSIIALKNKICCTACGRNLQKELSTGLLCTHPAMEVILCKECLEFYGDGLYKTDKKGDDVYCRWCAQGGTIYCCSKCSVAFCKKCIDRNLKTDKKVMTDINKDTWACFICVSKPLWYLRAFHWAVQKYKKDLLADSRKRKLSTSSIESGTPKNKPGPASAKKSLVGPASAKKAKLEEAVKKPGPASSKRPGPASLTKVKVIDLSDDDKPIQTRHKKIDYSPKIEFPMDDTPKRRTQRKKPTASKAKNTRKAKKPAKKRKSLPDVSSDEEFDDFEDDDDEDSAVVEDEVKEPVERVMEQVLDFCFKLSNNFNTKLIKYGLYYKGNLTTSDKINSACSNLHMDLKKIVRLYNAIDEKMMNQLDEFNAAQQALEAEKLALEESVLGAIDCDEYGIDPKTPPEPEIIVAENDESQEDTTMGESNPIDITDESEERAKDKEQTDKTLVNGEESQENSSSTEDKVNEGHVENGIESSEEIPEKLDEASKQKESGEEKDDQVSEDNKESQPDSEPVVAVSEDNKESQPDSEPVVAVSEENKESQPDSEPVVGVSEENKESQLEKAPNSELVFENEKHDEINNKESNDETNTKPDMSTHEAMDIEEVGIKPAESDANEISSDDKPSDNIAEQSKDDENSKNDVDSITVESTSTENKDDDKTDVDESFASEVDGGERTENQNKDETIGSAESEMELDNNQDTDVNNGTFGDSESKDDFSFEKTDDQKRDEPKEFEIGSVKNGEAKDNEDMEVDDTNDLKDVRNGSKDKVDETDGLSDISDKSDCFNDFDKVAVSKEPNFPTPSATTPSN